MTTIKVRPLGDRVVIEEAPAESKTASGIIIPDTAKEKPQRGKVVAVGPGLKGTKIGLKVDDEVLYGKYAGNPITLDGKDYLIMRECDIFMIL